MVRVRQSGPREPQTGHPGLWASGQLLPYHLPRGRGWWAHSLPAESQDWSRGSLPVWPCLSLPDTRPPRGWEILGG